MVALAASGRRTTVDQLVLSEPLPRKFLESIMNELRRAGLVTSRRGVDGGYALARPAAEISVADILRAVNGPLAEVHGVRPEHAVYSSSTVHLGVVWIAVRASVRNVLEHVTLAELVSGQLPTSVTELSADPDAWVSH